ncbi:MAG: anthranilate synthase component I [Gammaproteobacteria bacterium]|nr:anthranilate synthase component I [Gammaproteobacteria bacterium]
MLNQKQFNQFADAGYNRIPLVREVLADLETPLSTYLKLADTPYSYLLESVQGGEKWGRYSIIGLHCNTRLEIKNHQVTVIHDKTVVSQETFADPLEQVRVFQNQFLVPEIPELPRFSGGLVGFFGYDTVSYIEPHLGTNPLEDPIDAPDILLMVSQEIVVFDNLSGRLFLVVHVDPSQSDAWESGKQRLESIKDQLHLSLPPQTSTCYPQVVEEKSFTSSFPQQEFESAVEKCREYIFNGDAFQIVLSQRLSLPFHAKPLDLYRALRTLNPSPYMYYLNLDGFHIAGASPEILVRLEEGEVTLRPIAGTRRRGTDAEQDEALANDLLSDPKELAEHLMLIDLGRNDVGRVSKIGTVEVTDKMAIEKYSHVMHIVSNVRGQIKPGLDAIDVLKATFPAGTLSGAPKVRAMEIFEGMEPDKRGIYSGAIGYIGWNGNMDTAIAIRTALIKDKTVHIQAGAGIVADSEPRKEWEETMNKGRAVFKAVEMAHKGLQSPLGEE